MSTEVGTITINPGSTVNVYCKGAQTAFDVIHVGLLKIFGDMNLIGCNAEEKYVVL